MVMVFSRLNNRIRKLKYFFYRRNKQIIDISKILIGQQAGFPLEKWVEISKEYGRISVPIANSPYVIFLKDILKNEDLLNDSDYLKNTSYFKMGAICIRTTGHFMGATNKEELKQWMNKFYQLFKSIKEGKSLLNLGNIPGHSKISSPIILIKLRHSNCYEIVDGHHRIAIWRILGKKEIESIVVGSKYSALQQKLLKINQIHDIELYQPIDRLEVKDWPVVRNCKDRFEMMTKFLKMKKILSGSIVDLACSYGWFPLNFKKKGFQVLGIDRDPKAIKIAQIINSLEKKETRTIKIEDFFKENRKKFDVVLFLSILHHYSIGKEKGKVKEILRKLDRITKKVLFLDTGQNHEKWNKHRLSDWNDDYIIRLIKENTSFRQVIPLGRDKDNRGKYRENYRRTIFACIK